MYDLVFLPEAGKDISDISRYIGVELCNPDAADRLVDKILSETEKLTDMPYMYSVYESPLPLKFEYRKLLVKNYTVFYYIDESEKAVKIARVIYAKRNFSNVLE
ncbi:MAG: type II toxin-antitoxin system RelE/ParE family toxin [Oscillospiraceae bacterium]|nr:type II toxin-antitoxin system RelE/ParE family toxin [Oscillospiraceae bacterium]